MVKLFYEIKVIVQKKMEEFINFIGGYYVLVAGLLGLFSFYIINKGASNAAKQSEDNINKQITIGVENAIKQTKKEVENSTRILKSETDTAVRKITSATAELSGTLELINNISKNLENNIENQEVLIKSKYTFTSNIPGSALSQSYFNIMKTRLTENNYYELILKSNTLTTTFESENNTFQYFNFEEDGNLFKHSYGNSVYNSDLNWDVGASALLEVNYKLNLLKSNFLLSTLKEGDEIIFSIANRIRPNNKFPTYTFREINAAGASFLSFDERQRTFPKAKLEISILLKNGVELKCETKTSTIMGISGEHGIKLLGIIKNIIPPSY